MNLKPIGKRLVVKRKEQQQATGKLILQVEVDNIPYEGEVMCVGNACESGIEIGDTVLITPYNGMNFCDDKSLFLVNEESVLGVTEYGDI